MNDNEIKPLYIPESSGNALPDLSRHGSHNETPIPLHRTRTEPSRAMSDQPMKHLLPGGAELRDIIKRRIEATSQSTEALWSALERSYQTRTGHHEAVLEQVANMIKSGELVQRDGELRIAEPPAAEIPAEMWTMTQTARLLSVLSDEPRTRAWLAARTGLKPKQVSKAMNHLIGQGRAEVVGDVPRTWRRKAQHEEPEKMDDGCPATRPEDTEPETAVLTEQQTRDVLLERISGVCDTAVAIADVMRLSGWSGADVRRMIDNVVTEGGLVESGSTINKPSVKSEDPPEYEIGDDDDGEIPEPGVGRPETPAYVLDSATIDFVQRDSGGYITDECSVTIDADGLCFGGGEVLSFEAIDAVMPVLRRVHRAVFGDGD